MQYLNFLPLFQPLVRSQEDIQALKEILAKQHAIITRFGLPEFKESGGDEAVLEEFMRSDSMDKLLKQMGEEVIEQVRTMKLPRFECQFYCYDLIEFLKSHYDPSGRGEWRWKTRKEEREMEEKKRLKQEQEAKAAADHSSSQTDSGNVSPSKKRPWELGTANHPEENQSKRVKQQEAIAEGIPAKISETASIGESDLRSKVNSPPSAANSLQPADPTSSIIISPMKLPPPVDQGNHPPAGVRGGASHAPLNRRQSLPRPAGPSSTPHVSTRYSDSLTDDGKPKDGS